MIIMKCVVMMSRTDSILRILLYFHIEVHTEIALLYDALRQNF